MDILVASTTGFGGPFTREYCGIDSGMHEKLSAGFALSGDSTVITGVTGYVVRPTMN